MNYPKKGYSADKLLVDTSVCVAFMAKCALFVFAYNSILKNSYCMFLGKQYMRGSSSGFCLFLSINCGAYVCTVRARQIYKYCIRLYPPPGERPKLITEKLGNKTLRS